MAALQDELKSHIAKWRLTLDGAPFETHSSWLAPVHHRESAALLKVYKPKSDEGRGVAALLHWGRPAVRVLEHDDAGVVIERAVPGTTLIDMVEQDDDGATNIWCDTALALHDRPAPEGFPTLWDCGRSFNKPWPEHEVLTRDLFERGKAAYFELCETQSVGRFLLHTDLHHANVLKDDTLGWLVIDPKGYAGEVEFETASFLHNPTREYCAPKPLARRVRIVAERLSLDPERLLRWVFAHGVLAALWSVQMPVFDPIGGVEAANAALEVLGHKVGS